MKSLFGRTSMGWVRYSEYECKAAEDGSFMLTDQDKPIRICKHCSEVFAASRPSAIFCSPQSKNKHNVYKSRTKEKKE